MLQLPLRPIRWLSTVPEVTVTVREAYRKVDAPVSAEEALNAARQRESVGDMLGAAESYRTLAHLMPTPEVFLVLGATYFRAGEYEKSASAMTQSLGAAKRARRATGQVDPKTRAAAHFGLALADTLMGKPQSALREITLASRLKPEDAGARLLLGHIRVQLRQWDAAERAFEEAIRLSPELKDPYLYLAELYASRADQCGNDRERSEYLRRAVAISRRFLAQFPNDASQAHNNLGVLHSRMGDIDSAIREYDAAAKADPDSIRALNNLARAC
ncbi:MAG: tetratricopeptide repeat protein, partial [Blastocatellia bacterium]